MAVDAAVLAKFYPLDKLGGECIEQLAKEAEQIEVSKGSVLFRAGDTDDHTIYVAAGVVRGDYPDGKTKSTDGSSLQGRYALGDLQPLPRLTSRNAMTSLNAIPSAHCSRRSNSPAA